MTAAEAEQVNARLGHELLTAYLDRARFEAKLIGVGLWGRQAQQKDGGGTRDAASDDDLAELGMKIGG